jgi:hypothetical protein
MFYLPFINNHIFLSPFKPSRCQQKIPSMLPSILIMPDPNLARRRCKEAEYRQQEAKIFQNGMLRDLTNMMTPVTHRVCFSQDFKNHVYNKNKNKTKPSQHDEKKRKAPDLDSVTPSALKPSSTSIICFPARYNFYATTLTNTKMAADPPADNVAEAAAMLVDQSPKNNPPAGPPADDAAKRPQCFGTKVPLIIHRLVHRQMLHPNWQLR